MKKKVVTGIKVIDGGSSPDVDSDINTTKREDVIRYITEVYGKDNVSNIITFGRLAAKSAFKQICTIYTVPYAEAQKISNMIPAPIEGEECTLEDIFNPASDRYSEGADFREATSDPEWQKIVKGARSIEGRNKNVGAHACGVIISSLPLNEVIPLHVRQNDERVFTQWTYKECESLGLIKMDLLGLDTVDLIQNSVEYIVKNGKTPPNMTELIHTDMDDPKVYELFQQGKTVGVFQFGSEMVRNLLLTLKPTNFNDLAACTAVARPGPMGMQSHIKYADRKNGREEVDFIHKEFKGTVMEEILGNTFGLCVPAGTPILDTTTGLYIPIENITPDVTVTPSFNESNGNTENKTITNLVQTGFKNITKISLNGGRSLRVSDTHPVLTQRGYIPAGEITTQDKVVVSAQEVETQSVNSMSNDRSYFLGAMLGDGSITGNNQPYITNSEEDILLEMERISSIEFPTVFTHRTKRLRDNVHYTTNLFFKSGNKENLCSGKVAPKNEITTWLSKIGYNGKVLMYDKFVSDYVMSTSNESLKHLIGGIWDTDGMVSNNMIHFTTTSRKLFEDVKNILTRVGVDFGSTEQPYINKTREDRTAYRIYPTFVDFKNKIQPYLRSERKKSAFISRTAISHNGKTENLAHLENDFTEWVSENVSESLYTSGVTNALKSSRKVGWKAIKTFFNTNYGTTLISKTEVINFAHEKGILNESTIVKLNTRLRSVVSVIPDGIEMCYDIEVEDNHNFFVNGVVVHNCVYQEQVIKIANLIAGMTLQEGDDLRKSMGKKNKEQMDIAKPKFLSGSLANGYSEEAANTLWDTIAEFAKYGFNKSHSVAYAMNAYQSAYLKTHYPIEFMSSIIAQNIDSREKTFMYMREAKQMGITMGTVDINLSDIRVAPDYTGESGYQILFGFSGVKGVSATTGTIIVKERNLNGPYKSVQDTVERCSKLGITKSIFENLAKAGAFDRMETNRNAVVHSIPNMMGEVKKKTTMGGSLFDMFDIEEESQILTEITDYSFADRLKLEADMVGLYLSAHPLDKVERGIGGTTTIGKLLKTQRRNSVTVIASISEISDKKNRRGRTILLNLDDGTGFMTARLTPKMVSAIEKTEAQHKIKRTYERGLNSITPEDTQKALNPSHVAINKIEKNSVYLMNISYSPAWADNPYSARIEFIKPMTFSHNGTLPIRLRLKITDENIEKMRKLYKKLPAAMAKREPGDYAIHISAYRSLDMSSLIKRDYPYRQAVIDMANDKKTGREETEKRIWPPEIDKTAVTRESDLSNYAETSVGDIIESLDYKDSGYSTNKCQSTAQFIEKYIGVESYDLGIFNPDIFDDN